MRQRSSPSRLSPRPRACELTTRRQSDHVMTSRGLSVDHAPSRSTDSTPSRVNFSRPTRTTGSGAPRPTTPAMRNAVPNPAKTFLPSFDKVVRRYPVAFLSNRTPTVASHTTRRRREHVDRLLPTSVRIRGVDESRTGPRRSDPRGGPVSAPRASVPGRPSRPPLSSPGRLPLFTSPIRPARPRPLSRRPSLPSDRDQRLQLSPSLHHRPTSPNDLSPLPTSTPRPLATSRTHHFAFPRLRATVAGDRPPSRNTVRAHPRAHHAGGVLPPLTIAPTLRPSDYPLFPVRRPDPPRSDERRHRSANAAHPCPLPFPPKQSSAFSSPTIGTACPTSTSITSRPSSVSIDGRHVGHQARSSCSTMLSPTEPSQYRNQSIRHRGPRRNKSIGSLSPPPRKSEQRDAPPTRHRRRKLFRTKGGFEGHTRAAFGLYDGRARRGTSFGSGLWKQQGA